MTVVWENPPPAQRGPRGAERSPLRKEVDDMLAQLYEHPGRWARLYDFEEKEDADKRSGFIRSAAGGRGWGVAVRYTPQGWSIFAMFKGEPEEETSEEESSPE